MFCFSSCEVKFAAGFICEDTASTFRFCCWFLLTTGIDFWAGTPLARVLPEKYCYDCIWSGPMFEKPGPVRRLSNCGCEMLPSPCLSFRSNDF